MKDGSARLSSMSIDEFDGYARDSCKPQAANATLKSSMAFRWTVLKKETDRQTCLSRTLRKTGDCDNPSDIGLSDMEVQGIAYEVSRSSVTDVGGRRRGQKEGNRVLYSRRSAECYHLP